MSSNLLVFSEQKIILGTFYVKEFITEFKFLEKYKGNYLSLK